MTAPQNLMPADECAGRADRAIAALTTRSCIGVSGSNWLSNAAHYRPGSAVAPRRPASGPSTCQEIGRYPTAVLGQFSHDLLVQPPVHGRGVVHVTGIVQLLGKLLASGEATVEVEEFHQVHD